MSFIINAYNSIKNIYNSWYYPNEVVLEPMPKEIYFKDTNYDKDTGYLGRYNSSSIKYEGMTFPNVEAAFQAAICEDKDYREIFAKLWHGHDLRAKYKFDLEEKHPSDRIGYLAEILGKNHKKKISNLKVVENKILEAILYSKFNSHEDLKEKLLDTNKDILIEYEGPIKDIGYRFMSPTEKKVFEEKLDRNKFGNILMRVRDRIREEKKDSLDKKI